MSVKRKMNLGFGTNPDNISITTLPPQSQGTLNGVYEQKDQGWQFMQLVDAGPSVAGDVGYYKLSAAALLFGQCTRTIGNSKQNLVAGVFPCAVPLLNYTLIRKRGAFLTASGANPANGDQVTSDVGSNRVITAATVIKPIGVALEAGGATVAAFTTVQLDIQYM